MPPDWRNITYLKRGNSRQRKAYAVLRALGVFEILRAYDPVLVGTVPIEVDIETSDVDIICNVNDLAAFEHEVTAAFGSCEGFQVERKAVEDVPRVVADFYYGGFPFQVFGQPRAVEAQNGYRHMVIEARLLEIGGEAARDEIRRLKRAGFKTEPAFARYFGLEGDPYVALLELASLGEDELRRIIR
ncbi:MAG: DUF4269 domain-containing protein [Acidobacteriota bacterium]